MLHKAFLNSDCDRKSKIAELEDLQVNEHYYRASLRLVDRMLLKSGYNQVNLSTLFSALQSYEK